MPMSSAVMADTDDDEDDDDADIGGFPDTLGNRAGE